MILLETESSIYPLTLLSWCCKEVEDQVKESFILAAARFFRSQLFTLPAFGGKEVCILVPFNYYVLALKFLYNIVFGTNNLHVDSPTWNWINLQVDSPTCVMFTYWPVTMYNKGKRQFLAFLKVRPSIPYFMYKYENLLSVWMKHAMLVQWNAKLLWKSWLHYIITFSKWFKFDWS